MLFGVIFFYFLPSIVILGIECNTFLPKYSVAGSTLPVVTGLIFKCKNEGQNTPETIQLRALEPLQDGRKASINWIVAMQKVLNILSTHY